MTSSSLFDRQPAVITSLSNAKATMVSVSTLFIVKCIILTVQTNLFPLSTTSSTNSVVAAKPKIPSIMRFIRRWRKELSHDASSTARTTTKNLRPCKDDTYANYEESNDDIESTTATTTATTTSTITWWEDYDGDLNTLVLPKGDDTNVAVAASPLRGGIWNPIIRRRRQQQQRQKQQQQQQEPHPLRTDLYEIHCRWRGIATLQQHHRRRCQKRRTARRRSFWTSRLALKNVTYTSHLNSSLSSVRLQQRSIDMTLDDNNNNNNDDDDDDVSTRNIYNCNTFQLEFDPLGYVRLLSHPLHDAVTNHYVVDPVVTHRDRSRASDESARLADTTDDCIGTWKLQPNGLIVQIPLPTQQQHMKKQKRQQHVLEMDFHMNPFGGQPKLTRGIIFIQPTANHNTDSNNNDTNPIMKFLRLRPIVGTFTGKGIGIDTVDLSYQQRI